MKLFFDSTVLSAADAIKTGQVSSGSELIEHGAKHPAEATKSLLPNLMKRVSVA